MDKYYFFDLDVEISKERERGRDKTTTRFDAQGVEFFNRVREGYKKEIIRYPHQIIDASKTLEEVTKIFQKEVLDFLNN